MMSADQTLLLCAWHEDHLDSKKDSLIYDFEHNSENVTYIAIYK